MAPPCPPQVVTFENFNQGILELSFKESCELGIKAEGVQKVKEEDLKEREDIERESVDEREPLSNHH